MRRTLRRVRRWTLRWGSIVFLTAVIAGGFATTVANSQINDLTARQTSEASALPRMSREDAEKNCDVNIALYRFNAPVVETCAPTQ